MTFNLTDEELVVLEDVIVEQLKRSKKNSETLMNVLNRIEILLKENGDL